MVTNGKVCGHANLSYASGDKKDPTLMFKCHRCGADKAKNMAAQALTAVQTTKVKGEDQQQQAPPPAAAGTGNPRVPEAEAMCKSRFCVLSVFRP